MEIVDERLVFRIGCKNSVLTMVETDAPLDHLDDFLGIIVDHLDSQRSPLIPQVYQFMAFKDLLTPSALCQYTSRPCSGFGLSPVRRAEL